MVKHRTAQERYNDLILEAEEEHVNPVAVALAPHIIQAESPLPRSPFDAAAEQLEVERRLRLDTVDGVLADGIGTTLSPRMRYALAGMIVDALEEL